MSEGVSDPPQVKILFSSIMTTQDNLFSLGKSGRDPKTSPLSVVVTLDK